MEPDEVLLAYMNEHYAHARDHEDLRGQITSILCAAAFVLIGFAGTGTGKPVVLLAAGLIAAALGLLNLQLNGLHESRFDSHTRVARAIRDDFERRLWVVGVAAIRPSEARKEFKKRGDLSATWDRVPMLVIASGVLLAVYAILQWVPL
jgi:hypothetical protein